ncbi:MAG: histidine phosphatase family protein [Burkholderiaceae bacterium]|jgi:broad specificity phosphatase PhoE|nr:histidine phosphatase family protein [Burkholderiaceae bacterium]MEB2320429.1 histidine phosphatase family protein [Pseudomonadota bacterium]
MPLFLVRHGETALNAARVLQPPDTPLSERGFAQARAIGARLAGESLAGIVASDMTRAAQTAEAIAEATGLPLRHDPLLRERSFGDLRGRSYDSLGFDPMAPDYTPPGGESWEDFTLRVGEALAAIRAHRAAFGGPIAVVSHGLVIRVLLNRLAKLPEGVVECGPLANTGLSIIGAEPPHQSVLVNCVRHLDEAIGDDGRGLSGF